MKTKPIDIFARAPELGSLKERLTEAQLRKLDAMLERPIPPNLRRLLTARGGIEFLGYCRDPLAHEGLRDVRGILGNTRSDRSVRDFLALGFAPPGFIPFADDDGDNLFLLREDGRVVWIAHDGLEGDEGEVVAESLDAWLGSLVVEDTTGGD